MILDPRIIYFTHSRIRDTFSGCGRTIAQTESEILSGTLKVSDIPMITVLFDGARYYSHNNRRLFLFKKLGLIEIEVRVKLVEPTKNQYALTARLGIPHPH